MIKRYSFSGIVRLLISYIYTRTFYNKTRIIRFPFDIRNKKHIDLGVGLTTGFSCRLEAYPQNNHFKYKMIFGENVELNDFVHIAAGERIEIGNNVLIASKVFISDINHGNYKGEFQDSPLTKPNDRKLSTNPVKINDNVWIGEGVCIMPGVTIGIGSIIGASSVVTKDIPDYSIAVGNPAKVVKKFNFEENKWVTI